MRSVTWEGRSGTYGKPAEEIIGEGKDSEASEAIIRLVDRPDPRPVWFCVWGGPCDLAQAIWKVRADAQPRRGGAFPRQAARLPDREAGRHGGSGCSTRFPGLFVIVSEGNYMGMFWNMPAPTRSSRTWRGSTSTSARGTGRWAPRTRESGFEPGEPRGSSEGDSPSFLHLAGAVRGRNDPERPDQAGLGRTLRPPGPVPESLVR